MNILIAVPMAMRAFCGFKATAGSLSGKEGLKYPKNMFVLAEIMTGLTFPA